jgi:hypothetical protein
MNVQIHGYAIMVVVIMQMEILYVHVMWGLSFAGMEKLALVRFIDTCD